MGKSTIKKFLEMVRVVEWQMNRGRKGNWMKGYEKGGR